MLVWTRKHGVSTQQGSSGFSFWVPDADPSSVLAEFPVEISAGSYGTRCGALPACFVKDVVQARRKRSTMNFMERMEVDAEHKQAYAQAGLG